MKFSRIMLVEVVVCGLLIFSVVDQLHFQHEIKRARLEIATISLQKDIRDCILLGFICQVSGGQNCGDVKQTCDQKASEQFMTMTQQIEEGKDATLQIPMPQVQQRVPETHPAIPESTPM